VMNRRRARALAEELVSTLPTGLKDLFNPWADRCEHEAEGDGWKARRERLVQHLSCDPSMILVGEAPGYRGCRYSGVPFVSERLLLDGAIPRIPALQRRITSCKAPLAEPSATLVWKALYRLGVAETTILWNAVQLHPHIVGDPWSNRTPKDSEVELGQAALKKLVEAYPGARIVAVGRKAELALGKLGVVRHTTVRHPANGGATEFFDGLARAAREQGMVQA